MTRADLQLLSRMRQREARVLLVNKHYAGAYYLTGYSIECALKAAIARRVNRHDFPDKKLATDAYSHDLSALLKLADLKAELEASAAASASFAAYWIVVKDWSVDSRYRSHVLAQSARNMYSASTARDGILPWIRRRW